MELFLYYDEALELLSVGPYLLASSGTESLSKSVLKTSEFLEFDAQWHIKRYYRELLI